MEGAPLKGISKTSEAGSSHNRTHSPHNDYSEEGYSGDRVSYQLEMMSHNNRVWVMLNIPMGKLATNY